jgi:hypothetical protein
MAHSDTVESDDRNFIVTRIMDGERNRLVVFGKDASVTPGDAGFRYSYVPTTSSSDHVIVNLAASTTYYVAYSGTAAITIDISKAANGGTAGQTDTAGVLQFSLGVAASNAPRAPANVRVTD